MHLQSLGRAHRWPVSPKQVDQASGSHDLVRMQHEDREQRSLPSTPKRNKAALVAHLQRTKDSELHALPPRHRDDRRAGAKPPAYASLPRLCRPLV